MNMRRDFRDVAGVQPKSRPAFPEGSVRPQAAPWFTGIFPAFLQRWASLGKKAIFSWLDDRAPTIGAAIAFYTMFSLAPMLVIVIAVAGFVFGREAAEGALFGEIAKLVGPDSAGAVQAMLRSASSTRTGIIATAVGIGTLIATATAVFSELQAALNLIWKVPAAQNVGVAHFLKSRFLSLCVIVVIGFLLLLSLVASTALTAFGDYIDRTLPNFSIILYLLHHGLSFCFTTVFFAVIFKILPDHPVEWQDVWLSAALTALLFSVGKHLISLYIGSSNMASTYGAAGALIIVFVWVYYSAQIFLLGAEFAKVHSDQRRALRKSPQTEPPFLSA
ncbi:MAG: YihY/virulence factor BrkB family protein [Stellaceae bacterium]